MINWLRNGSWERSWHDDGNRQIPEEWRFWFADESIPNPLDNDLHPWMPPEARVLPKSMIPPEEHDLFFTDGDQTYKIFASHKPIWVALTQELTLPSLSRTTLKLDIFPDLYVNTAGPKEPPDDPNTGLYRFRWRSVVNDTILNQLSGWKTLQPYLMLKELQWKFRPIGQQGFLTFEVKISHPIKNAGFFVDNVRLYSQVSDCDGAKDGYDRTTNVFDPSKGKKVYLDLCNKIWDEYGPQTITPSTDESLIGCGHSSKVARFWHVPKSKRQEVISYQEVHYPHANVTYEWVRNGEEPVPPVDPPRYEKPNEVVTMHLQDILDYTLVRENLQPRTLEYLSKEKLQLYIDRALEALREAGGGFTSVVNPEWVKVFSPEHAAYYKSKGAKHVLCRFHMDGQYNLYATDLYKEALAYVNKYRPALETHGQFVDAVEGTNEEVASSDLDKTKRVFEFEYHIAGIHSELGLPPTASPNIAIGNLEYEQLEYALFLMKRLYKLNGFYTYHAYWPVQGNGFMPVHHWDKFDERWMWHWKYFADNGAPLQILLTESGPCGFSRIDNPDWPFGGFLATQGWRNDNVFSGSIEEKRAKYFESIRIRRERWMNWNEQNGYPLRAVMLYTWNHPYMGWHDFRHEEPDTTALASFLKQLS